MSRVLTSVADGDLTQTVPVDGGKDLNEIAVAVNRATASLRTPWARWPPVPTSSPRPRSSWPRSATR
ncbi:HAMP domain-containing protein [Luedemannella flava]